MQATKFGVFSLSASSPDGDDSRYLRWHALDHLPQQYTVPGVLHGQRWVSTPDCRARRAAQTERFEPVNHVVHYLFGDPVRETADEFFALRDHLIEIGRFPERLPNHLVAGCDLVGMHVAPRADVSADVLPFRPNLGAYLVVERGAEPGSTVTWEADAVDALLDVDGVAGVWTFAPADVRPDEFSRGGYSVAVCYMEEEPAEVAKPIGTVLADRWARGGITPGLAAPFVALTPWTWEQHRRPG